MSVKEEKVTRGKHEDAKAQTTRDRAALRECDKLSREKTIQR
jgi:hypothetical protein